MSELVFTSSLGAECRDELERLLFFNDNQARASEGVAAVVRQFGTPRVTVEGTRLRVGLGSHVAAQSLYVLLPGSGRNRLIGAVVYTRRDDTLLVLFVAVDGQYSSRGERRGRMLLVRMIAELKCLASRIRGISAMLVYLGRPTPTRITIVRGRSG